MMRTVLLLLLLSLLAAPATAKPRKPKADATRPPGPAEGSSPAAVEPDEDPASELARLREELAAARASAGASPVSTAPTPAASPVASPGPLPTALPSPPGRPGGPPTFPNPAGSGAPVLTPAPVASVAAPASPSPAASPAELPGALPIQPTPWARGTLPAALTGLRYVRLRGAFPCADPDWAFSGPPGKAGAPPQMVRRSQCRGFVQAEVWRPGADVPYQLMSDQGPVPIAPIWVHEAKP